MELTLYPTMFEKSSTLIMLRSTIVNIPSKSSLTMDLMSKETSEFDKEWFLILDLCKCALASGSEAAAHQVSRLADFHEGSARGAALRDLLERKGNGRSRLVPSEQATPVARVVETWRNGPKGRENIRKNVRWFVTAEALADGTELYAVAPSQTSPSA